MEKAEEKKKKGCLMRQLMHKERDEEKGLLRGLRCYRLFYHEKVPFFSPSPLGGVPECK